MVIKQKKNMKTKMANFFLILAVLVVSVVIVIIGYTQQQSSTKSTTTQSYEAPTTKSTINFLTYDSSAYGIRIKYPFSWTKNEQFMGTVVTFLSPLDSDSDIFQENLIVFVQDLSTQPMTLDEYTELSINQIQQIITDVKIVDSSAKILDGNLAHQLVCTGKQGKYDLKWMQIWTIKDNKAYIITYTAKVDTYSNFLSTINQMINSFEIN